MNRLTDEITGNCLENGLFVCRTVEEIKKIKTPTAKEAYIQLCKYENLLEKYNVKDLEKDLEVLETLKKCFISNIININCEELETEEFYKIKEWLENE